MRFRSSTTVAALIAVFALAAFGSASAWASAPEFAPGPGEILPASMGNSIHTGNVSFTWPTMTWGTCNENKTEATITAGNSVSLTLEWAGCSNKSEQWHTEGSPEGHIVLTGPGTLAYINRSTEKVGIVFPIKEVKILAGSTYIKLRGTLVIPITPLHMETSKFALPIHEKSLGEQEIGSYENENGEVVEARPQIEFGTTFKKAAIEVQGGNELTTNKPLTIETPSPPPPPLRPEFALTGGRIFPVALEGSSSTAHVSFNGAAGSVSCEGVNTKGTITGSTALSSLTYELKHCKKGETTACQTTGAESGTVVLTGSANLFYIKKSEEHVALVWTVENAKVTCGSTPVNVRGTLVIRVTPVDVNTTLPILTLTRNGEAYENTYTTYENEKNEVITTKLELNFGTGYKKGVLETRELHLTADKALTVEG